MTIRGKKEGAAALCTGLTDREFVMLARDILVMRGHRQIRVTDGPGDGMRDVHSVTRKGARHVTQVAHTRTTSKTIGSPKMAELPAAMIKFGAKAGLFITSGKLSPQAKREFLGDYPDLELDFLDGDALADEILRSVPLKAIWYDGRDFGRVSNCVRIPFLLRDLETDRAVQLDENAVATAWPVPSKDTQLACQEQWVHASAFNPYRQPESAGLYEGISPGLRVHELVLSGLLSLDELARHTRALGNVVLERARSVSGSPLLAVRLGQAVLVPLKGEWSGTNIRVGPEPYTLIACESGVVDEWPWLAEVDDEWLRPKELRHANADWVRRLNADLDVCFAVTLVTTATEDSLLKTSSLTRVLKRDWERSVFCLMDPSLESALATLTIQPTDQHRWADGRLFALWRMRDYLGPFVSTARADDDDFLGLQTQEDALVAELARVREALAGLGAELLPPRSARHMAALVGEDPFPPDGMTYRFVDLERGEAYPSPVDARGRWLTLDVCWRFRGDMTPPKRDAVRSCLREWSRVSAVAPNSYTHEFDETDPAVNPASTFLRLQILEPHRAPLLSTRERLRAFAAHAEPLFKRFEMMLQERGFAATRATREYWDLFCEMSFRDRKAST